MNKMRVFKKSILAVTIGLASQQAFAAGFQLNAQSATGLGRALAGDAVIADNASVMARNAAAMALFDKTAFSMGFETITSQIEVKDATYNIGAYTASSDYDDAGDTSVAPNIHLIVPVSNKFAWGVDLYSNFGTKTDFDNSFTATEYGGFTEIKTLNLGLASSYRIDKQWSVGAGLDVVWGYGKMTRNTSAQYNAATGISTLMDTKADGFGLGFNVGTVYELDDKNRFGLSYHYQPDIKAKGDLTYKDQPYPDDTITLKLPDMAEFSGYHRLNQEFAVHYSIQWIQWSEFDTLDSSAAGVLKTYDWKDGWHYAIGGTYYLSTTWTLRAGYMYDTSAQDQVTSVSVPDSDRQWFSTGFTYHIDEDSNVDFGFTYLLGKDVSVTENSAIASTLTATTQANAILMGLQYSRTF